MKENYNKLKVRTKRIFKFGFPKDETPADKDPTTVTIITYTTGFTIPANSFGKHKRSC